MNLAAPPPENEKSNTPALVLSALVHMLLVAALFFGVQWKSLAPTSVEVEVWRSAPAPVVKAEPTPEPPPKPKPEPEPKPIPKAEPAPTIKPDITLKDDKKPKKEPEPKKPDPKPVPKPEPKPAPQREALDFSKQIESEQKQLDQQKVAQDQRARAEAELKQLGQLKAERASASSARGQADYFSRIGNKIRDNIVLPPNIVGNPEALFDVIQLPTGEVLSVKLRKSSGNKLLDDAIERAIIKSSPLPKPDDPALFRRDLPSLKYRPFEQ